MNEHYFDHAATSSVHPHVLDAMIPYFTEVYGNPSSTHRYGRRAKAALRSARERLAMQFHASADEFIFTSGGTEANNLALMGYARANRFKGTHLITSKIEHHAVLHTVKQLEAEGFSVTYLDVDQAGKVSTEAVRSALTDETILVSIMYGNNEVGTLQPIKEIGALLQNHQAAFHTDAVQAAGLETIDCANLGVDLFSLASHKVNGPKGVGCLFVSKNVTIAPLTYGGEQERKRRAGTENVAGIVGFAKAMELANEQRSENRKKYKYFRDTFIEIMDVHGVEYVINGSDDGLPHILNVSFKGVKTETLLMKLDLIGIVASGGSACTAGTLVPSHVIEAMYGVESRRVSEAIRFSFGFTNVESETTEAFKEIARIVLAEQKREQFIE
ncbi:cysteine desulfurase family protein [Shouchella sp. JSM 1781072]|uniref:cysteine desulfurase family protein n=1 Tax=Shouchella sp. JSM 1781072 TaxID=3344581 RepID=UPI0035C20D57